MNVAGLVLEEGVFGLGEVQHMLGEWQDRGNVRDILDTVANVNRQDLRVRVSRDVGLNRYRDVSKVKQAAILMSVEEGQVHSFVAGSGQRENRDISLVATLSGLLVSLTIRLYPWRFHRPQLEFRPHRRLP